MTSHDVMTSYASLGRPAAKATARAFCESMPEDLQLLGYLRIKVWLRIVDAMDFEMITEITDDDS